MINIPGHLSGCRVGGFLLQAGPQRAPSLLQVGGEITAPSGNLSRSEAVSSSSSSSEPTLLYDVFARVGGPECSGMSVDVMVRIDSPNVVLDNVWLWRADHCRAEGGSGAGTGKAEAFGSEAWVKGGDNPVQTGVVVGGSAHDVIAYGMAVEHTLGDMLVWNGERGRLYFYQAEFPYDVTQDGYGRKGYVGYRVGAHVKEHKAYGVGVYCFFRDYGVSVHTGIAAPASLVKSFVSPFIVFLTGHPGSGIGHVINEWGGSTYGKHSVAKFCG